MKKCILVCVKMVPADKEVKMNESLHLDRKRMSFQLNIADMAAVEWALLCKDQSEATVTVITMGTKEVEPLLKDLIGRGVDQAVLISDSKMAGADTHATAIALAAAFRLLGPFDVVVCGRKAIDGETGQVPGELAAQLELPCVSNIIKASEDGTDTICERLLEKGTETLKIEGPMIMTLCEYSYTLRLPGIKGKRRAAKQPVVLLSREDLNLLEAQCGQKGSKTKVMKCGWQDKGLRKGPRETNPENGIKELYSMLLEEKGERKR